MNVLALATTTDRHVFVYDDTKESFDRLLQILQSRIGDPFVGYLSWEQATFLMHRACDCRKRYLAARSEEGADEAH